MFVLENFKLPLIVVHVRSSIWLSVAKLSQPWNQLIQALILKDSSVSEKQAGSLFRRTNGVES
jgi:hypothetical protein